MTWLLAWQHLIFLIPLGFGMLLVFGAASGLIGHGDVDVDHEFHVAEADHDVVGEHDVAQDGHDGAHAHDVHDRGFMSRALSLFGIGRVPLSIILTTASLLWGGVGLAAGFLAEPALGVGFISGVLAVAAAWLTMTVGTGSLARLVARVMPTSETYRVTKRDLIGRTGTMLFPIAPQSTGYVQVNDHEGNL